jgi:hypothetical protein
MKKYNMLMHKTGKIEQFLEEIKIKDHHQKDNKIDSEFTELAVSRNIYNYSKE